MKSAFRTTAVLFLAVALVTVCAAPASAQESTARKRSVGTIVKWAAIGAAAGTGLGFMLGWKAYEKATFAEEKITRSMIAGGCIGLAGGLALGFERSKQEPTVAASRQWQKRLPLKYPSSLKEATRRHPIRPPVQ